MYSIEIFGMVSLLALCLAATWTDLKNGKIPNVLTVLAALFGLVLYGCQDGLHGVIISLCSALVAALVPLLLFRFGAMGGGDTKLFFAIGSIVGVEAALEIQMLSFAAGSLFGIGLWIARGTLWCKLKALATASFFHTGKMGPSKRGEHQRTYIKFAPFILLASSVVALLRFLEN